MGEPNKGEQEMSYDASKVDFKAEEHDRAKKLDATVESILQSLDDGFQPLQDIPTIGMGVWGFIDAVRTAAAESSDENGDVDKKAVYKKLGYSAVMLERDNSYL